MQVSVLTATPTGISIEYNRNFTGHGAAISAARQHCAQYNKVASLIDTTISPSGNWYTRTFQCEYALGRPEPAPPQ